MTTTISLVSIHHLTELTTFFLGMKTFFFWFLGPHLWHMEVSRLGVSSELQLLAYTTAIATWDPSHVCDLHYSSPQCRIPNPLSEARDGTLILMDSGRIHFCCAMKGTPWEENLEMYSAIFKYTIPCC